MKATGSGSARISTSSHLHIRWDREAWVYVSLAAIAFGYILARAAFVPICHDEVRTFQQFTITGRFLPFIAHWDAANHPLCTLLGWVSYTLFGPGVLSLRLFSVLSFILFAAYLFRLGAWIDDRLIRWCTWLALLTASMMLEFFALYRGYGMAMAFFLMGLYHAVRFLREGGAAPLGWSMLGFGLATFGSLSVLLVWAMWWAITFALMAMRWRKTDRSKAIAILVAAGGMLLVAAAFGQGLRIRGALYYGGSELLFNTIGSLCRYVLGLEPTRLHRLLIAVSGLLLPWPAIAVIASRDLRPRNVLLVLSVLLLFADLLGRWVMHTMLGTPYPEDRTALHLVPLFLFALTGTLDRAVRTQRAWRWAALPLLFLPLRTIANANMDHIRMWPREAIPSEVFDLVQQRQRAAGRPLLIGGYGLNICPWNYGNYVRGRMIPEIDAAGHPQPDDDLLILDPTLDPVPHGFHTLFTAGTGHLLLLERDVPLALTLIFDTTVSQATTEQEYINLWDPPPGRYNGQELLLRLEAPITSPEVPLEAVIALDVKDTAHTTLHYISDELASRRLSWNGDTLVSMRRVPRLSPASGHVTFYFYNRRAQPMSIDGARLRVYRIGT